MDAENNKLDNSPGEQLKGSDGSSVGLSVSPSSPNNIGSTGAKAQEKQPLVTIAAQLTFKGDKENKKLSIIGRIFGIIMVLVAFAGAGGSIYAANYVQTARQELHEESNPDAAKIEKDAKQAIADSGPDTQDGKDGKVDVSKLFDAKLGQHEQDIKAPHNKQINISNGFSFMVTGVERKWSTGSKYKIPNKGKEFVKIAVSTGSRSKDGYIIGTNIGFNAVNSKGAVLDDETISNSILPDNELNNTSEEMNGGDVRNGWVVFEVYEGEQFTLVYESEGSTSYITEEFVMKGSVDIQ